MKRVFHIISRFDVGGAENVAINIAMSQNSEYEQHIVELQRGHSEYTYRMTGLLNEKNIIYHRSWLPIYFHLHCYVDRLVSLLFPIRFLYLWLRYKPAIVHTHTEMPDMALWFTLRIFPFINVKVVRTIHNTVLWSGMNTIGPKVEKFMNENKANVAISQNVRQAYHSRYGSLPPVIYNGVSPVRQHQYNKIVPDKINICFAGRFEEQKGIDILCSIIRHMKDDRRYYFHIFGSGRQQHIVEGISNLPNVSINPPISGISSYLSSFDYLIMPSRHEGLSILALEASFNGLPAIINDCAGLSDTLPEDWPLKVDNNDIKPWMHIFNNILPGLDTQELKQQAYTFANRHFSMEGMQKAYIEFYNSKI